MEVRSAVVEQVRSGKDNKMTQFNIMIVREPDDIDTTVVTDPNSSASAADPYARPEATEVRGEPFQAELVVATRENFAECYPEFVREHSQGFVEEQIKRIETGKAYFCVARDPSSGAIAGGVAVNLEGENVLSIHTAPAFRRRGVAQQLIWHLQERFVFLSLDNTSGEVSERLYRKMGFVSEPKPFRPTRMKWTRSSMGGGVVSKKSDPQGSE